VADLSNNVGNLVNRVVSMIERYRGGTIPNAQPMSIDTTIAEALVRYRAAMDENLLHHGAAAAIELASAGNVFIEERAPWAQAKDPARAADLDDTLGALVRALIAIATMLQPFVPARASEMARRLGLSDIVPLEEVVTANVSGRRVQRGDVLFPKPKDD
jgi:methionyl-tRNA synthetase